MTWLLHRRIVIASILVAYFYLGYLLLYSINWGIPAWVEKLVYVITAPMVFSVIPWNSVLAPLGLVEGEFIRFPNLIGFTLITAVYGLSLYLILTFVKVIISKR
jgi:hypothetical protein